MTEKFPKTAVGMLREIVLLRDQVERMTAELKEQWRLVDTLTAEVRRQKWITERVATLLITNMQPDYERALAQAEFEATASSQQCQHEFALVEQTDRSRKYKCMQCREIKYVAV